ncbi:hypothetical protein FGO68_gene12080 [Halteria grandinella]|uniref:Uncharacterized protein n=1 Tax=Halteria grandinella TaxID=5974 RepID=A0A8J8P7P7_HALGN|nr:hypothetical protein FGO68_gene12080 [Halteria grandinella]
MQYKNSIPKKPLLINIENSRNNFQNNLSLPVQRQPDFTTNQDQELPLLKEYLQEKNQQIGGESSQPMAYWNNLVPSATQGMTAQSEMPTRIMRITRPKIIQPAINSK